MCPECIKNDNEARQQKLENLKSKFREQAKEAGLTEFAIVPTVNDNPGFMWRSIGHPDCDRLGVAEYCVVY